jgi:CubicO group peptidase (beta-lactamase class C family)/peptidoglycan/LPS O-acetylase OafA/YrhL
VENERRDTFLDAVRAVAVARVVTWHTYGWAPITWFVAAVPAMFFVSGHLLARSMDRRSPRTVVLDRLRRLLVPYWVFGLVAWLVMAAARAIEGTPETVLPWRELVRWVVPFDDPKGSVWEAGWLSQPLWYVRCWLWLLVLSPLLVRAARRAPGLLLCALVAITVGLEVVHRNAVWHDTTTPQLVWRAGDVSLYAVFLVAGFLHAWRPQVPRRVPAAVLVAAVPLAAAVFVVARPQDDVVNNSHVLHLVVGAGWLALALTFRGAVTTFAARPLVDRVVRGIGRRSLTIYLWHSAAVITTWHLIVRLAPLPTGVHSLLLALGTLAGTATLVTIFGRVEDLAARRRAGTSAGAGAPVARPRPLPLRRVTTATVRLTPAALGAALFAMAAAQAVPLPDAGRPLLEPSAATAGVAAGDAGGDSPEGAAGTSGRAGSAGLASSSRSDRAAAPAPRVPSRAPTVPLAARAALSGAESAAAAGSTGGSSGTGRGSSTGTTAPDDAGEADGDGSLGVPVDTGDSGGGTVQDVIDGWQSAYASAGLVVGVSRGANTWIGGPFGGSGGGGFDMESVAKTVTASAAWLLVDEGALSLDGPLPAVAGLPELDGRGLTVRHLLGHTSGVPEYHFLETPEETGEDPALVVARAALQAEAGFGVGEGHDYSSTNYLILGLVIEAVTGRSLDDVLWSRVLNPVGLGDAFGRASSSTSLPGGGAGGLTTDLSGMLAWGDVLLRRHQPVGDATFGKMTRFSSSTGLGLGLMGMCPCDAGFRWVGHTGGTTALFYDRETDVVVALRIANGIWGDFEGPFNELVESLREAAVATM